MPHLFLSLDGPESPEIRVAVCYVGLRDWICPISFWSKMYVTVINQLILVQFLNLVVFYHHI